MTRNTRLSDAGRLGAAAAAVVVTLAAVLTTVTLMRAESAENPGSAAPLTGAGTPSTDSAALSGPVPPAHDPLPAAAPGRLSVPAIGLVSGSVIELGHTPTGVPEVPAEAMTVGWLSATNSPGERGAAVLTGYRDFAYERGAFYGLGKLAPGAEITVNRADGTAAVFTVYRVQTLPKDFALSAACAHSDHPDLRLLTASGRFGSAGTGTEATVVFARLTGVTA
ncbi:sortase [Saccharomonospora sp. NPDC046836]|uniref:sortase domain-containing protein n=1 Tax=Saccharomonospora sp. NPDC046836 TaxID=3156921 RepID=UPI0033D03D35